MSRRLGGTASLQAKDGSSNASRVRAASGGWYPFHVKFAMPTSTCRRWSMKACASSGFRPRAQIAIRSQPTTLPVGGDQYRSRSTRSGYPSSSA